LQSAKFVIDSLFFRSSVKYPNTRYCWSTDQCDDDEMVKGGRPSRKDSTDGCSVGRRAESSNWRWYVAEKSTCTSPCEETKV